MFVHHTFKQKLISKKKNFQKKHILKNKHNTKWASHCLIFLLVSNVVIKLLKIKMFAKEGFIQLKKKKHKRDHQGKCKASYFESF